MRRYTVILVAALFCAASAHGQQSAFPESLVIRDPRAAAMAGAGSADCSTMAYSSMNNTAVLPFSAKKGELAASYSLNSEESGLWKGGVNFGAGLKLGEKIGVALSGTTWKGTAYELIDDTGFPGDTFTPDNMFLNGGFGIRLTDFLGIGAGFSYNSEKVAPETSMSAIGAKASAFAQFGGLGISLGARLMGKVKDMNGASFSMPSSAFAGLCYKVQPGEKSAILACADADIYLDGGISAAAGLEYAWNNMIFLRGGYSFAAARSPLPSCWSAGAGLKLKGIAIDAAYTATGMIFGLAYSF